MQDDERRITIFRTDTPVAVGAKLSQPMTFAASVMYPTYHRSYLAATAKIRRYPCTCRTEHVNHQSSHLRASNVYIGPNARPSQC
jgi:hypothetical protein